MIRLDRVLICLAALGALTASLFVYGQTTSPATSAPASQPAAEFKPAFTAMDYFDVNCARCHGPQGSFYGKEFGKHLSDTALTKVVRDMAEGPGNAPLKDDELQVEVAYHRSLIRGEPFVSVTADENGTLRGEVSPGSTVTVDGKPAEVDGAQWSAPEGREITVTRDKKKTVLRTGDGYSHRNGK